ncbi:Uncharacterised protein [Vibrio cholerae]|nr:Uncharacterised protein [Vibrio cholerae]
MRACRSIILSCCTTWLAKMIRDASRLICLYWLRSLVKKCRALITRAIFGMT